MPGSFVSEYLGSSSDVLFLLRGRFFCEYRGPAALVGYEGFCCLVEFLVAAVGSDETAADCDDPVWAWHLQLEVGIMGYGHEESESWSPENCVVLRLPVDYFEVKRFLSEVCCIPKDYLQA